MQVEVLAPGLLTTVQDRGRHAHRALGIGSAGAVDAFSARIANLLLGNPEDAALLEITLSGPRLRFESAIEIAICGGDIDARCNGTVIPGWRPVMLPAAAELRLGAVRRGCRSYLAVSGGWQVPCVLGSRSTDVRAGFGGVEGRALCAGDRLQAGPGGDGQAHDTRVDALQIARWWVDPRPDLDFNRTAVLHVLPGIDDSAPPGALFRSAWTIDPASNRQGIRLRGPALALADDRQRLSEPVLPGTLQLPAGGQPILLLAEAQTIGGYARIGHVAGADLPRAAQLRPGEPLHFRPIEPDEAWRMHCAQRQRLARMAQSIAMRRQQAR
jgi:biotin-dependent carboxylase-like uncharacterized protein